MVRRPRFAARAICVSGFCGVTFTSKAPAARWLMVRHSLGCESGWLSVRHRCHACGERILESEVAHIPHPLREQDAIEMIDLVLHHAGMKAFHGTVDRRTVPIEAPVAQASIARYQAPHSG